MSADLPARENCPACDGDAGDNYFDRSLCPCENVMHTRHRDCGFALDGCSFDSDTEDAERDGYEEKLRDRLEAAERERDSLRLERDSLAAVRLRDNEFLIARAERAEAAEAKLREALERLASLEGFDAIGKIPDDMWGRELKARGIYARAALAAYADAEEEEGRTDG